MFLKEKRLLAPALGRKTIGGIIVNKTNKTWLWLVIAALAVAAIAFWCGSCAVSSANGAEATFKASTTTALLFGIFVVSALGYLLGSISVKGVSLGTAGVFLVAILFGYLCTLPQLQNIPVFDSLLLPTPLPR